MSHPRVDLLETNEFVNGLCAARDHVACLDTVDGRLDRDLILAELRSLIDDTVFGSCS